MKLEAIDHSLKLGQNVKINGDELIFGQNVCIGDNVCIEGKYIRLADNVHIGSEVTIHTETLCIGYNSVIEARCQLSSIRGQIPKIIRLGENAFLGHDSKIHVPVLVVGDYVSIHNHCLLYGVKPMTIGHNCWIGQNCVLNSEGGLTIGNNVGIGLYCSLFSHGYFGDLLEGCQIFDISPLVIEDDAWLASHVVICSGITLGKKALVLLGSTVTGDVAANHTVGGSPARDLTDRITPYRNLSPNERMSLVSGFIQEYVNAHHAGHYKKIANGFIVNAEHGQFAVVIIPKIHEATSLPKFRPLVVFTLSSELKNHLENVTVFNLLNRTYHRTRNNAEIEIIKFLKSYRARFVPEDNPRVCLPDMNVVS